MDSKKKLIAIKDAHFLVTIIRTPLRDKDYSWKFQTNDNIGFSDVIYRNHTLDGISLSTPEMAIENWKMFAELNGIISYKISDTVQVMKL